MALRFAVGGLLPGGLVAWELGAHYRKATRAPAPAPKLAEGSTLWLLEREAQTLDLVFFRRRLGPFGPSAALGDAIAQRFAPDAPFDGVGVIVRERDGSARVLRAHSDGSVSLAPLAAALAETGDFAEVCVRPLAWPRADRDGVEGRARAYANGCALRFAAEAARPPWAALRDARAAPAALPRTAWPAPPPDALLVARLDGSVSPAAALAVDVLAACGVVAPQYRAAPCLPADLWAGDVVPLRRGARYPPEHRVDVKAPNAR